MSLKLPFSLGTTHIFLVGKQPRISDNRQISFDQAVRLGAHKEKISQLIVAGNKDGVNAKQIMNPNYTDIIYGDGVLLTEYQSAGIIQTADCPALILRNKKTRHVILAHAGRPALTGDDHCPSCTVITNALTRILESGTDATQLEALVIGDICGHCFKHDHETAKHLVEPFRKMPNHVFADPETGALSLFEVIKHILTHAGVPAENINRRGPCTFETPGLSSYRRVKTELPNTVILINA